MKTRCPQCKTEYPLVPATLKATRGVARCANCEHIFNAFEHRVNDAKSHETPTAAYDAADQQTLFADEVTRRDSNTKPRARLWQIVLLLLLIALLAAQLIWMNRATLFGLPIFQPFCQWVDCSIAQKRAPESFQVIEREISHDSLQKDVLHFNLRFRNDASFAQALPDLLLHLFDNNEYLVARRRLRPHEYLPNSATVGVKVQPREIISVELAFMDPGSHASGFKVDFL